MDFPDVPDINKINDISQAQNASAKLQDSVDVFTRAIDGLRSEISQKKIDEREKEPGSAVAVNALKTKLDELIKASANPKNTPGSAFSVPAGMQRMLADNLQKEIAKSTASFAKQSVPSVESVALYETLTGINESLIKFKQSLDFTTPSIKKPWTQNLKDAFTGNRSPEELKRSPFQAGMRTFLNPPSLLNATGPYMIGFSVLASAFKELLSFGADTMRSMRVVAGTGGIGAGAFKQAGTFAVSTVGVGYDTKEILSGADAFLKTSALTATDRIKQSDTIVKMTSSLTEFSRAGRVLGFTTADAGAWLATIKTNFRTSMGSLTGDLWKVIGVSQRLGMSIGDTTDIMAGSAEQMRWGTSKIDTFKRSLSELAVVSNIAKNYNFKTADGGMWKATAADIKAMLSNFNSVMKGMAFSTYAGLTSKNNASMNMSAMSSKIEEFWNATPMEKFSGTFNKLVGSVKGGTWEERARVVMTASPEFQSLGASGFRMAQLMNEYKDQIASARAKNPNADIYELLSSRVTDTTDKEAILRMGRTEALLGDPLKSIVNILVYMFRFISGSAILKAGVGDVFGNTGGDTGKLDEILRNNGSGTRQNMSNYRADRAMVSAGR